MKKALIGFVVLILLAIIFVGGAVAWWQTASSAPSPNNSPQRIVIEKGSSAEEIAALLEKNGVIKDKLAFKIYTQVKDLSGKILAGEFTLPTNASLSKVVDLLLAGPTEVWVTIPEGFRREQIAVRFANSFGLGAAAASGFKDEFMQLTQNDEGYLFPDTYLFAKDAAPSAVVSKLKATFNAKTADLGLTRQQVIIASILERETATADEAPTVAGVFANRMSAGWPLQADATVQYATGSNRCTVEKTDCEWWVTPTRADLEIASVFNTYTNPGLPPSPIANPGLAMLKAAANPQATDYWFYIHDSDGRIHFSKTIEEHNANVARYLR